MTDRFVITWCPPLPGFSFAQAEQVETADTFADAVYYVEQLALAFKCPVSCFTIYDAVEGEKTPF